MNRELDRILNLNYSRLVSNRRAVLMGVMDALKRTHGFDRGQIQKRLKDWTQETNGKKKPYHGVAVYILEKKLKRKS